MCRKHMSCSDLHGAWHFRYGHAPWRKCSVMECFSSKNANRGHFFQRSVIFTTSRSQSRHNSERQRTSSTPEGKTPPAAYVPSAEFTANFRSTFCTAETSAVQNVPASGKCTECTRFLVSKPAARQECTASRQKSSELTSAVRNAHGKIGQCPC